VTNSFDFYGVSREPYIGNPERDRAAIVPFPGPGGGAGVVIRIENQGFITEYGHMDLTPTLDAVPRDAYVSGFSRQYDYASAFSGMRDFRDRTLVARWSVQRNEVVGYSGDTGYSEAPHLHYTIQRLGGALLCPTTEAGFSDGGWLVR